MTFFTIDAIDAAALKARVDGRSIAEFFRSKYQPYTVRVEGTVEDLDNFYEAWIRVRNFVGANLTEEQYDWSIEGSTISFYFTDQLTAAKVRLLA